MVNVAEPERLVPVTWGDHGEATFPVTVQIKAWDRVGLLKDVSTVLADERVNIVSVLTTTHDDRTVTLVRHGRGRRHRPTEHDPAKTRRRARGLRGAPRDERGCGSVCRHSSRWTPRSSRTPARYSRWVRFWSTSSSRTARRPWNRRRPSSRDRAARRRTPQSHWRGSVLPARFAALSAMTRSAPDFRPSSPPRASIRRV